MLISKVICLYNIIMDRLLIEATLNTADESEVMSSQVVWECVHSLLQDVRRIKFQYTA